VATNDDGRDALIRQIEETFQQFAWLGRRHLARQVESFGLTAPQYVVLTMIWRHPPAMTMGEIADLLQLPASSLTSMTDRLVREGLVERVTMPNDRRVVAATITYAGRALVERIEAINHHDLVDMLRAVTDGNLSTFSDVLTHMLHEFERTIVERGSGTATSSTPATDNGTLVNRANDARG
jgi:DNA-binding MarR family transcriptional regulator